MDRNTIIAIILSVIIITVGMTLQLTLFSPDTPGVEAITPNGETLTSEDSITQNSLTAANAYGSNLDGSFKAVGKVTTGDKPFVIENKAMLITLDPVGASVSSIKLKNHLDNDAPVEILYKEEGDPNALLMYAGNDNTNPIDATFNYSINNKDMGTIVTFSQDFEMVGSGEKFTITKTIAIGNAEEYLFNVTVNIKTADGKILPLNYNRFAYTLGIEPQVGPAFTTGSNYDSRKASFMTVEKEKKAAVKFKNGAYSTDDELKWAAIQGKYFSIIGIPQNSASVVTTFTEIAATDDKGQKDSFYFSRNAVGQNEINDVYYFYAGPELTQYLNSYDLAKDNPTFGLSGQKLGKIVDGNALGWLQTVLKWILNLFYKVIPNYGVAIILLTILIKLMLQPLSKKGQDSTAKMAALNPKIEELKVKHADNPEQLNAAMAKLYKEEKINPMGSCLPMLIQFPVFIALYGLLNKHFELRGAMFIPGWITDLSIPETIFTLPFNIPLLGSAIHLLPIIYTVSMIFSMKISQASTTQAQGGGMMKFMTYGMPIIFFFVLYNAPSGLLIYWTITNAISVVQQVFVNKKKKNEYIEEMKEKEEEKAAKRSPRRKKVRG